MRRASNLALALFLAVPIFSSAAPPRIPVVVELFTSEGCSDCPPADALLAELDRTQPVPEALIIPIEEHVDYWDSLGWRDPFSSAAVTERQVAYARRLGIASPYTPQMIVAGRTEFVGSSGSRARAAIAAAARAPGVEVTLTITAPAPPRAQLGAAIAVSQLPADGSEPADVFLAITEDGLASNVSAGENHGRHLVHRAVLRRLIRAGRIEPGQPFSANLASRLEREWKPENLHAVVFLQGVDSGEILGAAISRVTP